MASAALYVSSPDHASPTNTGIWLAKPRRWVHQQAPYLVITPSQAEAVGAQAGTQRAGTTVTPPSASTSTLPLTLTFTFHPSPSPNQALNVLANSTFSPVTGYDGVGKPLDL